MTKKYDVVIIGGGMVGASLACALAESRYLVAMLEARPFGQPGQPSYDERTIALAYGSKRIFEGLGIWSCIEESATPIKSIHVSERGRFGVARFLSAEEDVEALGYVVPSRSIGRCLYQTLLTQHNVDVIAPARLRQLVVTTRHIVVHCDEHALDSSESKKTKLQGRLLVAADGSASTVRQQLGIGIRRLDYGQTAIVANVTPESNHHHTAYERFTDTGPVALLPMSEGRCSLVWSNAEGDVDDLMELSDDAFLQRLQVRFGYRLGRFVKVGKRHAYPLTLVQAHEIVSSRIALLGNAAHSLHPVAGQGFNLALRDVAVLAELLSNSVVSNNDPGNAMLLRNFAKWRQDDLKNTIRLTDGLARVFTNPLGIVAHGRSIGLSLLDMVTPLRHVFVRHTMGVSGHLPRLAVGLPLR